MTNIPKVARVVIIGGGVIGLELGSVYKRLGAEVTIVEYAPNIIPTMDGAMGKELMRSLKKLGMKFSLSSKVSNVTRDGDVVKVTATNKKGDEVVFEGDYCLVAVGRGAYTAKLGLENVGIETDERGRINVNDHLQTAIPNIYAIGDVIKGCLLYTSDAADE